MKKCKQFYCFDFGAKSLIKEDFSGIILPIGTYFFYSGSFLGVVKRHCFNPADAAGTILRTHIAPRDMDIEGASLEITKIVFDKMEKKEGWTKQEGISLY